MTGFFGLAGGDGLGSSKIKPFSSVDFSKEEDVLYWINSTAENLISYYENYRTLYRTNIEAYSGLSAGDTARVFWANGSLAIRPAAQSNLPVLQPILESHLSRITSSRPRVSVLPVNSDEYLDLIAASTAEHLLEMSFDSRKMPDKIEEICRSMLICGHAYMLVEWDTTIGPLATDPEQPVPVLDEEGTPREDEHGNLIMFHDKLRLGDVNYKVIYPFEVLEQPTAHWEDKDWIIRLEPYDVYRLREEYPLVADLISGGSCASYTGDSFFEWLNAGLEESVMVYHLYHRATPSFPNGRYIRCTSDILLENTNLPYPSLNKYGELPIIRLDDTKIPGYTLPLPMTVMEAGKNYQALFNNINTTILRNMSLSAPKWMTHLSSGVRASHLSNGSNHVVWGGKVEPRLATPPTTPSEYFDFRQRLQEELYNNTGTTNIFNRPPPNTRAGVMLDHQEEQEFKRAEPLIKHTNDFLARAGRIAVAIMADMYDDSDKRVIKVSGNASQTMFMTFESADLLGPFDVKFERTSALPHSKQGRLNEAARMLQMGAITMEQYQSAVELTADPRFSQTPELKAYNKQIEENDFIRKGLPVNAPEQHEDHVEHLKALYPVLQSSEFTKMPEPIQLAFKAHIMAHEMFAWQRAQVSMKYAMKVAEHVDFVLFSALPEAIPVQMGMPPTPAEGMISERATTPGLALPHGNYVEPPGPNNPDAV